MQPRGVKWGKGPSLRYMPFEVFFRVKRPTGEPCDGAEGAERRGEHRWEGETAAERETGGAARGMGARGEGEVCVRAYGGKYEGRRRKGIQESASEGKRRSRGKRRQEGRRRGMGLEGGRRRVRERIWERI